MAWNEGGKEAKNRVFEPISQKRSKQNAISEAKISQLEEQTVYFYG
jgi:hypothetical protein